MSGDERGEWSLVRVGIIGSGKIGGTVAQLLVSAGHEVAIANSRGPESLADLIADLGGRVIAATVEDAAGYGHMALVAIPLHAYRQLPRDAFAGKIVIDANNYYPGRDGQISELDDGSTTSSELLAAHLVRSRIVKAFNTMYYKTLGTDGKPGAPRAGRLALFMAGDDADAKRHVGELVDELGFAAIDTGSLAAGGRLQQPGSEIYNQPMTGDEAERRLADIQKRAETS